MLKCWNIYEYLLSNFLVGIKMMRICCWSVLVIKSWLDECVFSSLFQVDKTFTASCESKVTPLTIAVFLKFSSGKKEN